MTPKTAVLQNWHDTVWLRGEIEKIPGFIAQDFAASGILPKTALQQHGFPALVVAVRQRLDPIHISLVHTIEEADWLAALIKVEAVNVATGRPVTAAGQVFIQFEGDKFLNFFSNVDFMTLFEEMGQLPRNSLAMLLSGKGLNQAGPLTRAG